jgi:dienelactone hydrolase
MAMPDFSLFDYDQSAPLDVDVVAEQKRGTVTVQDIAYVSPKFGKVTAYLVVPPGSGPFAGLLFVHWGQGNREEFVDEAVALAELGVVSLSMDAPHARPHHWRPQDQTPEAALASDIQLIVDMRRGLDLLLARPDVDPQRIGYVGHSLGATKGGILAAVDKRVRAYVLMGGAVSLTHNYRVSSNPEIALYRESIPTQEWEEFMALLEPFDTAHYISTAAPASLLFQFARNDEFISEEEALLFEKLASEPKQTLWYNCAHDFNDEARRDRVAWLTAQLKLIAASVPDQSTSKETP